MTNAVKNGLYYFRNKQAAKDIADGLAEATPIAVESTEV